MYGYQQGRIMDTSERDIIGNMAAMDIRKADKQGRCYTHVCLNMVFMSNSSLHQNCEISLQRKTKKNINYQLAVVYVKINTETIVSKRTTINK